MRDNTAYTDNTPTPLGVQQLLQDRLPSAWRLTLLEIEPRRGPDAVLELLAPDGRRATLLLEIKSRLDPADVPRLLDQAESWVSLGPTGETPASLLLAAPYLSERTRGRLQQKDVNYIDPTGNVLLRLDNPAVFVSTQGAARNPIKSSRPTRSLRGAKAAQVVRTLVDIRPPLGVRQIADIARTDPGNVSRLLELLEREALIRRSPEGGVQDVAWDELLEAWSRDYSLTRSNRVRLYLDARGTNNFLRGLRTLPRNLRYAVTGSFAAARLAPVAPAKLAVAYVDDAAAAADELGLLPAESGANVTLVEPRGEFPYERAVDDGDLVYVAPSQAVVDLLTGPGRNPAEADELLSWMRRNEDVWRA